MFDDNNIIQRPIDEAAQTLKSESLMTRLKSMLASWLAGPVQAMFYRDQGETAAVAGLKSMTVLSLISAIVIFGARDAIESKFGILDYSIANAILQILFLRQVLQFALVWERERKGLFVYSASPGRPPRWAAWAGGPRPTWIKTFLMLSLVPIVLGASIQTALPATSYLLIGCGISGVISALLNWSVLRDMILQRRDAILMQTILEEVSTEGTAAASDSPTLPGVTGTAAGRGENFLAAALYDGKPRQIKTTQAATRPETPARATRPEEPNHSTTTFSHPETAEIRKP